MLKNKGVILITTLLFVSLIVMFSVLVAQQGKQAIQSGSMYSQNEQAYLAALSGIEYARSQLYVDPKWMTSDFEPLNFTNNNVNVAVEYNGDNVTGYLGGSNAGDCKAYFTMSFAVPLPGASQKLADGFNPSHNDNICPYSSLNNSKGSADTGINLYRRDVPPGSCYVVSKGVCGKSVRYVEALLWPEGPSVLDGGTTIGGDITIESSESCDYDDANKTFVNIKTKDDNRAANITAFDPTDGISSKNITIKTNNSYYERALNNSNRVIANAGNIELDNIGYENLSEDYKKYLTLNNNLLVSFDDETMRDFNKVCETYGGDSSTISSGTYVFIKDTAADYSSGTWRFIPSSISAMTSNKDIYANIDKGADQVNLRSVRENDLCQGNSEGDYSISIDNQIFQAVPSTTGITFGSLDVPDAGSLNPANTVTVNKNVRAEGPVRFLVLEPMLGSTDKYQLSSTPIKFKMTGNADFTPTFSSPGDIDIHGVVTGKGNIFSDGSVAFNSGSELEAGQNSDSMAVYANENIYVKPSIDIGTSVTGDSSTEDSVTEVPVTEDFVTISQDGYNPPYNLKLTSSGSDQFTVGFTDKEDKLRVYELSRYKHHPRYYECEKVTEPSDYSSKVEFLCFGKDVQWNEVQQSHYDIYRAFIVKIKPNMTVSLTDCDDLIDNLGPNLSQAIFNGNEQKFSLLENFKRNDGNIYKWFSITKPNNENKRSEEQSVINQPEATVTFKNCNASKFTGTLFSKTGGIFINGGQGDFDITGALITNNGGLTMKNMRNVYLRYDPDYVPFFKDSGIITSYSFISAF